jgi:hypothetical protein
MTNLILVPLLLVLLLLALVFIAAKNSALTIGNHRVDLVARKKPPPSRDRFPQDTQPGTAPGGAVEDNSDDESKA